MERHIPSPPEPYLAERLFNLAENYARHIDSSEKIFEEDNLSIIRQQRLFGQAAYYAVINGEPVGYVVGHDVKRANGRRFVITSTFIRPENRYQGIGKSVYLAIIDSGVTLVSDWDLSPGAKALWASLMQSEPRKDVISFKEGYVARRRGISGK